MVNRAFAGSKIAVMLLPDMPAKPRLFFTPEPCLAAALAIIARHTGKPASRIVAGLLEAETARLVQLAANLEWAEAAKLDAAKRISEATGQLRSKIEPHRRAVDRAVAEIEALVKADDLKRARPMSPKEAERAFRAAVRKRG